MKKNTTSLRNSGTYTSPATPEYGDNGIGGFLKGWSSERVPPPTNASRRHISATALMPFNSGRALPSKWDDAERWITSPVSGNGLCKTLDAQIQKQPKSKSGPLGSPGRMYIPNSDSPSVPVLEGGSLSTYIANSPFTTGVLVPDGLSIHYGAGAKSNPLYAENSIARANTVPGLSDFFAQASLPSFQDDKFDGTKEADVVSRVVSRRDMATHMSSKSNGSTNSSHNGRSNSIPSGEEQSNKHSAKLEIRDVQVDKGATISRPSQKNRVRKMRKGLQDESDSNSPWDVADTSKNMSKLQREEARITAWENLQKAKAEAAIQKLEMKLEKRRSASMDKILNKLRLSQLKAQKMRRAISEGRTHQARRTSKKLFPFLKYFKIGSLRCCFLCRVH